MSAYNRFYITVYRNENFTVTLYTNLKRKWEGLIFLIILDKL